MCVVLGAKALVRPKSKQEQANPQNSNIFKISLHKFSMDGHHERQGRAWPSSLFVDHAHLFLPVLESQKKRL